MQKYRLNVRNPETEMKKNCADYITKNIRHPQVLIITQRKSDILMCKCFKSMFKCFSSNLTNKILHLELPYRRYLTEKTISRLFNEIQRLQNLNYTEICYNKKACPIIWATFEKEN